MAHGQSAARTQGTTTHPESVGRRFCGPPGSGNGGYTVGMLAKHLGAEVEVTLKRPIPLDAALEVVMRGTSAGLSHRGDEIASARVAELDVDIPEPVSFQHAASARARYPGYAHHPFPNCFVCGTNRACEDGMCLFTGPIGHGIVASSWVPSREFGNERGHASAELIGAALDCPGAWALIGRYGIEGPVVLGRMTLRLEREVLTGGRYVVMGWPLGREGRKLFCGTSVHDAQGRLCASAKATWIELR